MSNYKLSLLAFTVFAVAIVSQSASEAQVPRLRVQRKSYDVTLVSKFGFPVRVGIFGYANDATFRLNFDGGRTGPDVYTQELIAGERVVFVWDTSQRPLLVAQVRIDSDGELVLAPMYGAAAESGTGHRAQPKDGFGLPRIQINPKD